MILIGFFIILAGFLIFAWSFRGRVVQRGIFCRPCRFDLAGLDIDPADARCPECGNNIHNPGSRRTTLRRRSRLGLVVSILAILGIGVVLGIALTGNARALYTRMPDSTITMLAETGFDGALDELVARSSRVPATLSPPHFNRAVEAGLSHQADATQLWDPRWGEVLSQAFVNGMMSDEQIERYISNGVDVEMMIRDRVMVGSEEIGCKWFIRSGRMSGLGPASIPTGYQIGIRMTGSSVGDEIQGPSLNGVGWIFMVPIHGQHGRGESTFNRSIEPNSEDLLSELGKRVSVSVGFDVLLRATNGEPGTEAVLYHAEVQEEVLVLPKGVPVVETITDPQLIESGCEAIAVSPVRVLDPLPETMKNAWSPMLAMGIHSVGRGESIAIGVFLRDEHEEFKFGAWVDKGPREISTISLAVMAEGDRDGAESERARRIIRRAVKAGHIDIILRTDASLAIEYPEIDRVLGLELVFEDVPVVAVGSEGELWKFGNPASYIKACEDD